jgi:lyso-ornithine lipid O-acyltransferase
VRWVLRLALTFGTVGAATLALLPLHWLALRTGLVDPRRVARLWNRAVLYALGWRVRVDGKPSEGRPLLIASNHVSWGDVVVISAFADVTFVAKREVRNWPLFGLLAKLQNTVFIDRGNKRGTGADAAEMARRLGRGEALLLFPEGTTADGNLLLPFKSSLFGALEAVLRVQGRAAVQPAAIAYRGLYGVPMGRGERDVAAWTGARGLLDHLVVLARNGPLEVSLVFGEPVDLAPGTKRKAMAAQAQDLSRRMMAAALRG